MNIYVQLENGLERITNDITSSQIIEALGYIPASKNELNNILNSDSDTFYVVDANSNIIAKIDKEGLHTTEVEVGNGMKIKEHIQNAIVHITEEERQRWNSEPELANIDDDQSGELNIVDPYGNIIMKVDANGVHTTKLFLNGKQVTNDGGGGDISIDPLPTVTEADNGKLLKVVNGAWNAAEDEKELPEVATEDNEKILKVVDGKWTAATAETSVVNPLPTVTEADNGKVMTVVDGAWGKADVEKELPAVTSADNGKLLCVIEGKWTINSFELTDEQKEELKGDDYVLTEDDKIEIVNTIISLLPIYEGEVIEE